MRFRFLPIFFLSLAAGCATGRPGPNISATLVQKAECEFVAEGSPPIPRTARLHTLGNSETERGYLGLSCSANGRGSHDMILVFNADAGLGTIPDGTYPIVRYGTESPSIVAYLLYSVQPVYLAGAAGTVAIQRDSAGRLLARVHSTTVRRRRPW